MRLRTKRRARVVPVRPPAILQDRRDHDDLTFLRDTYFEQREPLLIAAAKVDYRPTAQGRAWAWFVEDVLIQSLKLVRRNGRVVHDMLGPPVWRQWLQMVRLAISVPMMPEDYYKFEFYRPEERMRASRYLHRFETKNVLFALTTTDTKVRQRAPLNDKVDFTEHAASAGLPVVDILCHFSQGTRIAGSGALPKHDLFTKPREGKGGRGGQVWLFDPSTDSYQQVGKDRALTADELIHRFEQRSRSGDWILQPRITTHHELDDLALGVASTCRIISILDEYGDPEPVVGAMRLPAVAQRSVDNIHAGGISAPIDLTTGTLGYATDLGVKAGRGRLATHPVTGGRIQGRILPAWDEVLELVRQAHRAFAPRVLVGWDVCITDDGPVLIEGNGQPCVDHIQRTHASPLGDHRYAQLLAFHVRRTLDLKARGDTDEPTVDRPGPPASA